jgi:hypothetical protein
MSLIEFVWNGICYIRATLVSIARLDIPFVTFSLHHHPRIACNTLPTGLDVISKHKNINLLAIALQLPFLQVQ